MTPSAGDVVTYRADSERHRGIVYDALMDVVIIERGDDVDYVPPEDVVAVKTGLVATLLRKTL
jgi:hypothetical protein